MGDIIAFIVTLVFIIFNFLPTALHQQITEKNKEIKQALSLSAKVLQGAVEYNKSMTEQYIYNNLNGVPLEFEKEINKDKLLQDFNLMLRENLLTQSQYNKAKENILVKVLVMPDRIYVAGKEEQWTEPYFYIYNVDNLVYLRIDTNEVVYYDNLGNRLEGKTISDYGLSNEEKMNIIINTINRAVAKYTDEPLLRKGLQIKIFNQENSDVNYQVTNSKFNVLEGITFFVVYAENRQMTVYDVGYNFKNYNVVGYTLE